MPKQMDGRMDRRMEGQKEGRMEGRKDGETLFYRTLPATTRGPKTVKICFFTTHFCQGETDKVSDTSFMLFSV